MTRNERLTATFDGNFVVFLIGMRLNKPLLVHKWLPVAKAMPAVGTDGSVGIWHETYVASPGSYESIYVNMPPVGLGKAGTVCPATGAKQSAACRMAGREHAQ